MPGTILSRGGNATSTIKDELNKRPQKASERTAP